jgi:hypothetical protein
MPKAALGGSEGEYRNPARGNEKGGVEDELGWYRRNFLAPPREPTASPLEEELA